MKRSRTSRGGTAPWMITVSSAGAGILCPRVRSGLRRLPWPFGSIARGPGHVQPFFVFAGAFGLRSCLGLGCRLRLCRLGRRRAFGLCGLRLCRLGALVALMPPLASLGDQRERFLQVTDCGSLPFGSVALTLPQLT